MSPTESFAALIRRMTGAVARCDAAGVADCFTPDGVYHDYFYGEFVGRPAIMRLIGEHFQRDARDMQWEILDPCSDGVHGYARFDFRYTATVAGSEGRQVRYPGMCCCRLAHGRIAHYTESFDRGVALVQLDFPEARIVKSLRRTASALR
jgi:ketosteroid isomerase-like protein